MFWKKTLPPDVFGDVLEKVKHRTNDASNDVSRPALSKYMYAWIWLTFSSTLDFKIEAMWKEDSMRTETKGLDSSIEHALSLLHDSPTSSSSSSSGHHRHHQGHHHLRRHYDHNRHHRSSHTPNFRRCGKRLHGVSVLRPLLRRGERAHWTLQNEVLLSNFALLSESTFFQELCRYEYFTTYNEEQEAKKMRRKWVAKAKAEAVWLYIIARST